MGQRWTSGAWGSSCTRWSAGHFLLMDRTSRYSYSVSTPAMIHSSLFTPNLLESGKESIQYIIAIFSDCDIELINWYQLLWYLQKKYKLSQFHLYSALYSYLSIYRSIFLSFFLSFCFSITFFFFNEIYSCAGKAEFQQPLLQSSGFHDPSEIVLICWFGAKETFLININVQNGCLVENVILISGFIYE